MLNKEHSPGNRLGSHSRLPIRLGAATIASCVDDFAGENMKDNTMSKDYVIERRLGYPGANDYEYRIYEMPGKRHVATAHSLKEANTKRQHLMKEHNNE
jgi:hypothetical protein